MDNIFAPNQRVIILQSLEKDPGRSLSNEMLQRALHPYGHTCSIAEVNIQVNWLEQRGYVTTERLINGLVIAHITRPGIDVATGHLRAEGIDAPMLE